MTEPHQILPLLTLVTAVAIYAGVRVCQQAWILLRDGMLHLRARRVLGALQDEVDQGRRTPFELFLQLGLHHLQLNDAEKARAFFEAASLAHPLSPHGHYGLGLAHRQSVYFPGRLQEEALTRALERDSGHLEARRLLLEFYVDAGLYGRADGALRDLPDLDTPSLRRMIERGEPAPLDGEPACWSRMTRVERGILLCLDVAFLVVAAAAVAVPDLRPAAIAGLALLPFHLLLFVQLRADAEGIRLQAPHRTVRMSWADLLDVVELPGGGFYLNGGGRSIFVSRHWSRYADILTRIKYHLYQTGWVPAFNRASPGLTSGTPGGATS